MATFKITGRDVVGMVATAAAYVVAGKLGLTLATVHASATAVWAPTGIALAAFLVLGLRVWPGVFLGAFLVNLTTAGNVATSLGIASGNMLEGLVGALLVNRFAGGRRAFDRPQDVLLAAFLAGIAATTVSATVGVSTLSLAGFADWERFGSIWLTWWLGDVVGALVVAPVIVLWANDRAIRPRPIEALLVIGSLGLIGQAVFGGWVPDWLKPYPISFMSVPVLLWPAFRFGPRGTATATVAIAALALVGTLAGHGPFALASRETSLLLLQAFMAVTSVTTLALAAAIAERERAQRSLRELEARNQAVVAAALDCIITIDAEGRIVEFNPAAERTFGFARADVLGRSLTDTIIPPALRDAHRRGLRHYLSTRAGPVLSKRLEMPAVRADGSEFPVELTIVPLFRNGTPMFFTGFLRDITELKRAEEARRQAQDDLERRVRERTSELSGAIESLREEIAVRRSAEEAVRLFSDIVKNAHIGLMVLQLESADDARTLRIVAVNPAADHALGIAMAPFVGKPLIEAFPAMLDLALPQMFGEVVRSNRPRNLGEIVYADDRVPEGTFLIQAFPLPDRRVCAVVENITERKRLETERNLLNAKLLEGQKLRAIGELAAGVAHEINNPTAYILSNLSTVGAYLTDLQRYADAAAAATGRLKTGQDPLRVADDLDGLRRDLRLDFILSDFKSALDDSREGGERIRDIVKSLKEFSHVDEGVVKLTDLNEALESAIRICWNEIKYKATVKREYDDLPPVPCYPQRIIQVFMNLLVNAAQAIHGRGEIFVSTRLENGEAVVRIRDTGCGIPPEIKQKLFEPFFTTKPVGTGTGLGLHVAHKVVKAHGGHIDVESEPGRWTEFAVRLPLTFDGEPRHETPAHV